MSACLSAATITCGHKLAIKSLFLSILIFVPFYVGWFKRELEPQVEMVVGRMPAFDVEAVSQY
jgi:hypothetical protein